MDEEPIKNLMFLNWKVFYLLWEVKKKYFAFRLV